MYSVIRITSFCVQSGSRGRRTKKSDYLSRCYDSGDWHIGQNIFLWLVHLWGPHPVDRFASHSNTKCKRFNFYWWVPGTEGLDALSQSFSSYVNELVPPPRLVLSCVNKMLSEKAVCTMVISKWRSAPFWLIDYIGVFKSYLKDFRNIGSENLVLGKGNNGCFMKRPLAFDIIALRCIP